MLIFVIIGSQLIKRWLMSIINMVSKNPIEIMPNGTEMTYLEDTYDLNPLREKHAIDQEKVLLFVGRIDVVKNIDFIIDVCAELSKKKISVQNDFL